MRYNTKTQSTTLEVENHEGGKGVKLDPKLELISILSTGLDNTFYEKLGERELRFANILRQLAKKDPVFVAKALIYARSVMGQRTVTHFGAVQLASFLSGNEIGKRFFGKRDRKKATGGIIYRLDDMLEIIACYQALNPGKPISGAMKRGFKLALEQADVYELAKYQGKGKTVSLVDVVNLVHPKPSRSMEATFKLLMEGKLKQHNTVEDKNTTTGQEVAAKVKSGELTKEEAQSELKEAKEDNYRELIESGKIGYLALIRNLKNILNNTEDKKLVGAACSMLTDAKRVKQALVFPHQIDIALEFLLTEVPQSANRNTMIAALDKAYELAIPNLTELFTHGSTAVVWDTSSSMTGGSVALPGNKRINKSPADKASLIGATLAKGIGADLYHFASLCQEIRFNPLDSVNTIKNHGLGLTGKVGHGTDFGSIFSTLKKYDRIFIISDMQGADNILRNSPFQAYCKKNGTPYLYTIDMAGYGTTMFKPTNKLVQLFGYSADIYESIRKAEIDPKAILKDINAIVI